MAYKEADDLLQENGGDGITRFAVFAHLLSALHACGNAVRAAGDRVMSKSPDSWYSYVTNHVSKMAGKQDFDEIRDLAQRAVRFQHLIDILVCWYIYGLGLAVICLSGLFLPYLFTAALVFFAVGAWCGALIYARHHRRVLLRRMLGPAGKLAARILIVGWFYCQFLRTGSDKSKSEDEALEDAEREADQLLLRVGDAGYLALFTELVAGRCDREIIYAMGYLTMGRKLANNFLGFHASIVDFGCLIGKAFLPSRFRLPWQAQKTKVWIDTCVTMFWYAPATFAFMRIVGNSTVGERLRMFITGCFGYVISGDPKSDKTHVAPLVNSVGPAPAPVSGGGVSYPGSRLVFNADGSISNKSDVDAPPGFVRGGVLNAEVVDDKDVTDRSVTPDVDEDLEPLVDPRRTPPLSDSGDEADWKLVRESDNYGDEFLSFDVSGCGKELPSCFTIDETLAQFLAPQFVLCGVAMGVSSALATFAVATGTKVLCKVAETGQNVLRQGFRKVRVLFRGDGSYEVNTPNTYVNKCAQEAKRRHAKEGKKGKNKGRAQDGVKRNRKCSGKSRIVNMKDVAHMYAAEEVEVYDKWDDQFYRMTVSEAMQDFDRYCDDSDDWACLCFTNSGEEVWVERDYWTPGGREAVTPSQSSNQNTNNKRVQFADEAPRERREPRKKKVLSDSERESIMAQERESSLGKSSLVLDDYSMCRVSGDGGTGNALVIGPHVLVMTHFVMSKSMNEFDAAKCCNFTLTWKQGTEIHSGEFKCTQLVKTDNPEIMLLPKAQTKINLPSTKVGKIWANDSGENFVGSTVLIHVVDDTLKVELSSGDASDKGAHNAYSRPGYCGAPIIFVGDDKPKIVGLHLWGQRGNVAANGYTMFSSKFKSELGKEHPFQ